MITTSLLLEPYSSNNLISYCCCRLIHLPLLNFLLGFPIQLLGLALLPYFGVKYLVEKDSIKSDAGDAFVSVPSTLLVSRDIEHCEHSCLQGNP